MLKTIYHDFLMTIQRGGSWEDLVSGYLAPNQAFLHSYGVFTSIGATDWKECLQEYRRRWWDTPDAVRDLLTRLQAADVDAVAQRGYATAVRLLQAHDDIPVYLFIGLGRSDSFMVMVENEPTVGLALEAYGRQFGATNVGFEDLPHMLAHELCHAVRALEADTGLTHVYQTTGDITRALDQIPLYELLVDEGLAEATGRASSPDAPLERILLYTPDDLGWCVEHEAELWRELSRDLDRPVGTERYRRFFRGGSKSDGLPPRTGYFLGYQLVQRYLKGHPTTSLHEAVRMRATEFLTSQSLQDRNDQPEHAPRTRP